MECFDSVGSYQPPVFYLQSTASVFHHQTYTHVLMEKKREEKKRKGHAFETPSSKPQPESALS